MQLNSSTFRLAGWWNLACGWKSDGQTFLMPRYLPVQLRNLAYAIRGGFLVRPFAIALSLGAAGMLLSWAEEKWPAISLAVPLVLFPSHSDPTVAQAILTSVATSIMTVVSIVFAILLMTLTLASTQFSPRILVSFIRDHVTQWTLGIFLGTFSYCLAALPAVRSAPQVFVPVATVAGAMVLAPVCVAWLIYFIYHISMSISVNHIVDRIRKDTEQVIDELMPGPRRDMGFRAALQAARLELPYTIASRASGYVRYVDIARLTRLARSFRVTLRIERRVGHFVPAGVPLLRVSSLDRVAGDRATLLLAAIDIGPTRTLQQDLEFGVVQIVDIALRALSPAVNDPTTAISCVDQLSAILIRWVSRMPPSDDYFDPPNTLRLTVPWIGFDGMLDLAFEQIRHYAHSDAAVSLRLMRALSDIASTAGDAGLRGTLVERGARLLGECKGRLEASDCERLGQRFALLKAGVADEEA
jgi:uncharacterized membrane protein